MGFDATVRAAAKGKLQAVFLTVDLSSKSAARLRQTVEIPVWELPCGMDEIFFSLSKRTGIIGVMDAGFAKAISDAAARYNKEDHTNDR